MSLDEVVKKFGIYFDEIGLNKTYGRMFGLFMTKNEPISMGKLVTELQISKSTASVEIRKLLKMGYIEKVLISDQRADFYQLKKDIWTTHFSQKIQMIKTLHSIIEEIPNKELESCKNLKEMGDYCTFIETELTILADKYVRNMKKEASGYYIEQIDKDLKFVVEWNKLPALSETFHEKMVSLADLGIATFREIEIEFLKAFPKAVEEDKSLTVFSGLQDRKLEEAMNAKIEKLFCTHPKELSPEWRSAMKDIYYFVVTIREEKSEEAQGFITFMGGGPIPKNEFKITSLSVDRNVRRKGMGSLLVNSLKKIGVNHRKVFASTRPSNISAISAYQKWGFSEDLEAAKNSSSHFFPGHWMHLYRSI